GPPEIAAGLWNDIIVGGLVLILGVWAAIALPRAADYLKLQTLEFSVSKPLDPKRAEAAEIHQGGDGADPRAELVFRRARQAAQEDVVIVSNVLRLVVQEGALEGIGQVQGIVEHDHPPV